MNYKVTIFYRANFFMDLVSESHIYENLKNKKQAYNKAYNHFQKLRHQKGINPYRGMILYHIEVKEN